MVTMRKDVMQDVYSGILAYVEDTRIYRKEMTKKLSNALKRKQKSLYYTKQETKFIQKKEFERSNQEKTITKSFKEFQCVGYIILHDKFGFGQKRLARLEMTVNTYLNSAADGDKNMSGSAMAYVLKEKYGIDVREEVNKVPQRQLMVLYSQKGKVVQSAAYKIASASMFNYLALTMMALKTILKMSVNQLHEFADKFIDYIDTLSNFSQYALTIPMISESLEEECKFKCDLEV